MAEKVQKNLELMSKELVQFKEWKIFNDSELKELLKMRKYHEYKINAVTKSLSDYQNYIKYETALLKLIRKRRPNSKNSFAGRKIRIRIKRLYEVAIRRFPEDLSVAVDYFMFCKDIKFISEARSALSTMIKNHPQEEKVWHMASKFYFIDLKDRKSALKTLRKGLAIHKNSKRLFKGIIKVEVLDTVNKKKFKLATEDDTLTEKQTLCLKKLEIYIQAMMKCIHTVDVYMEVLDFLKNHKFTSPVQKRIVEYLHINHSQDIASWNSEGPSYDVMFKMS